jgi:hypothetical protein
MNENLINIGSDLAKVDAHIVSQEEYDELPELTDEIFERAKHIISIGQLIANISPDNLHDEISTGQPVGK